MFNHIQDIPRDRVTVKEFIGEFRLVRYTEQESITNSIWLLYPEYCPKPLVNNASLDLQRPDEADVYPNLLECTSIDNAEVIKHYKYDYRFVVTYSKHGDVWFNKTLIDYLNRWIPDFNLLIAPDGKPAYVLSNGKIIGLLMPHIAPDA